MSRTTCPADHDDRTPVTVMLSPAQLMRVELYLAQVRETHPGADDNAITDLIFARGLDAVMETPMNALQQSDACAFGLPDKRQILITLGKLWTGCRPGDEMWCELDQQCLDTALGLVPPNATDSTPAEFGRKTAGDFLRDTSHNLAAKPVFDYQKVLDDTRKGCDSWRAAAASHYKARVTAEASHAADWENWRCENERLISLIEAARCRSIPDACAVLQDAVAGAGCCIHIDECASVEVMFSDDDSIHVLPDALPEVLSALTVIEQHRAPATLDTEA